MMKHTVEVKNHKKDYNYLKFISGIFDVNIYKDGLDGPGIESRWGGGGARFSAPVQTGPEAHPASCTMGTGSFPG
jgi:hypothetical protein